MNKTELNHKIILYVNKRRTRIIFKNIKEDEIPLITDYVCDKEKIIYKRKRDDNEKLIWEKTLTDVWFYVGQHSVLFYRKKMICPEFTLFIDESNRESTADYFRKLGMDDFNQRLKRLEGNVSTVVI